MSVEKCPFLMLTYAYSFSLFDMGFFEPSVMAGGGRGGGGMRAPIITLLLLLI